MAKTKHSIFFPGGKWSQYAWISYWKAQWSAPMQPGYAELVRFGMTRLDAVAYTLSLHAQAVGADIATNLLEESRAALPTYIALASSTDDGMWLRANVCSPLLTSADSPLYKIGRAVEMIIEMEAERLPEIETNILDEIAKPLKALWETTTKAAKTVVDKLGGNAGLMIGGAVIVGLALAARKTS